jgi:hypothetical protein
LASAPILLGFAQFFRVVQHLNDNLDVGRINSDLRTARHFLKYTSSEWEQLWLDNIAIWEKEKQICQQIQSQVEYLRSFMKVLCTNIYSNTNWCSVDDSVSRQIWWFNLDTAKILHMPDEPPPAPFDSWKHVYKSRSAPRSIIPKDKDERVFSRLEFINDYTGERYSEYIEPLVSHLRHPLSFCHYAVGYSDRSYIVPPPFVAGNVKKFYYDAGASQWNAGLGGPSLSFFTKLWRQHGIEFDHIECWEGDTPAEIFKRSVPEDFRSRVTYHQEWIASSPNARGPFLPHIIAQQTSEKDYVLFKLDIDNGKVEKGSVEYLLRHPTLVDEFVWEHHAGGNYLLEKHWADTVDDLTVHDSYQYFLKLRQRGIRAHSWV